MGKLKASIFIFRRDLRLEDNTGLIEALARSEAVLPIFIFDPRQIGDHNYRSANAMRFMLSSLYELDESLRARGSALHIAMGDPCDALSDVLDGGFDALFINDDYTPFSRKRDAAIESLCRSRGIAFHVSQDALLVPPGSVRSEDGRPYKVFSHFYRKASALPVLRPREDRHGNFIRAKGGLDLGPVSKSLLEGCVALSGKPRIKGGRKEGLKLLAAMTRFNDYPRARESPALDDTTHLSAHNKFGTISIREFFHAIPKTREAFTALSRELYWRDFFTHIAFHFPHVFEGPFDKRYAVLRWSNDEGAFKAWQEGRTGFPIVDAGMRELLGSGFMHNRVRMIVSSFLVKDLHIDWRWGERHFARHLIDYDPSVNNGNWQWAASTGCDAQPYFRIFNPWRQQERFDPECEYIKRWIPELASLPPKSIHSLSSMDPPHGYPRPIVDHGTESSIAKSIYSEAAKNPKPDKGR